MADPTHAHAPDAPPLDASRMPALLSYVRRRRCALFVGAGLSRPAGFPGWRGLMDTTLREAVRSSGSNRKDVARELSRLLDAGRYAEVADQCRFILGRQRFWQLLRAELGRPAEPPAPTHQAIVRTPFACIVTTNFDTLLEDAFARWGDSGVPKAPTGIQLGDHGTLLVDDAFFILKAHGSIHDEPSLVFTSEDYRRIIHANPAFQSMMSAILLSHALLFVGYSLGDPNFRLLIESQLSIFGSESPPRYAVMEGVGVSETQILRRTANIEVISYPEGRHGEVANFLQSIADATQSTPSRPARPAAAPPRPARMPALTLSLRPRKALLDAVWFETTSFDLPGHLVPPERRWMGTLGPLPWTELSGASASRINSDPRRLGRILGSAFARLGIPFKGPNAPRLAMLDLPHELSALPWEWLDTGDGPLCLLVPVCRMVSGLSDASRGRPTPHAPLRVLLVGDALAESKLRHPLPGTREEVHAIRDCFLEDSRRHQVTVLTGSQASFTTVLEEMSQGGYDNVHVAGVAYVDDSGESVLPLHDGQVRASEMAQLLIRRPPALVFFDADYSGFVPAFGGPIRLEIPPSGEFSDFYDRLRSQHPGFERVVGRAGVGTFIGCMLAAAERPARDLAADFYRRLLEGRAIADALFQARISRPAADGVTPLLFAMAGHPDTTFAPPPKSTVRSRGRVGSRLNSKPKA
ncbi:MAG: SIR2 family protein [Limisphaerales bacterium]